MADVEMAAVASTWDEEDRVITIYNFARGARGLRIFWQCEEMGLPYRVETVTFPPSAEYLAKQPLGSVPFLEDEGGVAIDESVAIMLYLAERHGPTPLLPREDARRHARVLQLTVMGETAIGMGLNPLLGAHFMAPEEDKRNWSVCGIESRVGRVIERVAELLGDEAYLAGDELTLADISVSCALGIWRGALGKPLPENLTAYRERLAARPAYQRASQKQAPSR
jgi:glutathione S-transferase